ncbi:MAG TPA: GDSL-type esterase/lipase family protein [Candidatus Limnocylindria bacterium]|nr:GDSL-type esterase/lipase family protein [Candidatus Limnocylindria bacterium]
MRWSFVFLIALLSACSGGDRAAASPARTATITVAPTSTPTPTATPSVRYVAIGASDTVGIGATDPVRGSWPARVAALLPPGSAYVNLGVSGSLAVQAKDAQVPGAVAQRPTVVSIWLAVNDMNATIEPVSYREALAAIVDELVARTAARVFVGNVPDVRTVPAYRDADKAQLLALITAYNDAIAAVTRAHAGRVFLVDLFTGSAPLVSTITVSGDGFHPSDDGYRLIAERFAAAMRAAGVPLAP